MTNERIETVEKLDALPIGSVVRTDDSQVWQRTPGGWDCLSEDGSGGIHLSETVLYASLPPTPTLLYRPDRADPVVADVDAIEKMLARIHFDGTGCGTTGPGGCLNCAGPSPMTAHEVAQQVAALLRGADPNGSADARPGMTP